MADAIAAIAFRAVDSSSGRHRVPRRRRPRRSSKTTRRSVAPSVANAPRGSAPVIPNSFNALAAARARPKNATG